MLSNPFIRPFLISHVCPLLLRTPTILCPLWKNLFSKKILRIFGRHYLPFLKKKKKLDGEDSQLQSWAERPQLCSSAKGQLSLRAGPGPAYLAGVRTDYLLATPGTQPSAEATLQPGSCAAFSLKSWQGEGPERSLATAALSSGLLFTKNYLQKSLQK
ncbi:hypothetical protein H1C71_014735 [Ictidomys tridecemlineatus]|nr:hypothetical protein H1C71_014735 [Ictidomys tridecemlineatus]